jgi:hypothetical protein
VFVWTGGFVCGGGEVTQVAVDGSDGGVPLNVLATSRQSLNKTALRYEPK